MRQFAKRNLGRAIRRSLGSAPVTVVGHQFAFNTAVEMAKVFLGYEHVLARTLEIAERCNVRLEKVHDPFPKFEVPAGYTLPDYFEHITRQGFANRLNILRELQTRSEND